jgi:hypothetical protein
MSETVEILIGICALVLVITLTRRFHTWKISRSYKLIIDDLRDKAAYEPATAVELTYARRSVAKMGVRDHRPMAMDHLLFDNIVAMTEDGKYYLKDKSILKPGTD